MSTRPEDSRDWQWGLSRYPVTTNPGGWPRTRGVNGLRQLQSRRSLHLHTPEIRRKVRGSCAPAPHFLRVLSSLHIKVTMARNPNRLLLPSHQLSDMNLDISIMQPPEELQCSILASRTQIKSALI